MDKLAIFDVDYTLTKRETLVEFYMFMIRKRPWLIRKLPANIISAILYGFKIYNLKALKQSFISFIDGIKEDDMRNLVKEFYENNLSRILYKDAVSTMKKLKSEGYKIFLISASAEFYLNELYNIKEVDVIIGTRYTVKEGKYRRIIVGENCKGDEKVKRLKEYIDSHNMEVDYKASYMFSDSLSDLPLFKLVGHPYLINYKKKTDNIQVLNWK